MQNASGLIVAVILGGASVVFNWIYLHEKAAKFQVESFLGIREGEEIQVGDTLLEAHFDAVPVPKKYAEKLQDYVYLYRDKATVTGIKATRDYEGGDLVHVEDYRTPARTIRLKDDERLIWVAVDSRAFVPALVNPGDQLTFVFPSVGSGGDPRSAEGAAETLGPFTIGALGTRLGDVDVDRGYGRGQAEDRHADLVGILESCDSGEPAVREIRWLLGRALQAYNRGKSEEEKKYYREILNVLNREDAPKYGGFTGRDRQIKELLGELLR